MVHTAPGLVAIRLAPDGVTANGPIDFRFQELDRLKPDYPAIGRAAELKRRQVLWALRLQAEPLPFA